MDNRASKISLYFSAPSHCRWLKSYDTFNFYRFRKFVEQCIPETVSVAAGANISSPQLTTSEVAANSVSDQGDMPAGAPPKDRYFTKEFRASQEHAELRRGIADLALPLLAHDDTFELRPGSIGLSGRDDATYLNICAEMKVVYNSARLGPDEIGRRVFLEAASQILSAVALLPKVGEEYGCQVTIFALRREFGQQVAATDVQTFTFKVPPGPLQKYGLNEISSRELLESSVTMYNGARVTMNLQ